MTGICRGNSQTTHPATLQTPRPAPACRTDSHGTPCSRSASACSARILATTPATSFSTALPVNWCGNNFYKIMLPGLLRADVISAKTFTLLPAVRPRASDDLCVLPNRFRLIMRLGLHSHPELPCNGFTLSLRDVSKYRKAGCDERCAINLYQSDYERERSLI